MSDERHHLVKAQEAIARWKHLAKDPYKAFFKNSFPERLTPLGTLGVYRTLTDTQKSQLFLNFAQCTSEFIILLEDLLIYSLKKSEVPLGQRLVLEEFYHAKAFRKFLNSEPGLAWPNQRFILKQYSGFQRFILGVIQNCPAALALPGAKVEAYSVAYSKFIRKEFGSEQNYWLRLNHLHLLDEVHHVPFEFDLFQIDFAQATFFEKCKTIILTYCFFLFLQWILLTSCWKMIHHALIDLRFFRRSRLSLLGVYWVVRHFPPSSDMRKAMRKVFKHKDPIWAPAFWLLTR